MYIYDLPKLNLEEIESLNGPIKEMESVVNLSINKTHKAKTVLQSRNRSFKHQITDPNSSKKIENKNFQTLSLILKLHIDNMRKENYGPISLMRSAKTPNKILANCNRFQIALIATNYLQLLPLRRNLFLHSLYLGWPVTYEDEQNVTEAA